MIIITIILHFVLLVNAQLNQWYVTRQDVNSQQPSPRSAPVFLSINSTHGILFGGEKEYISIPNGQNIFYNDVYLFDASNPDRVNWTLIKPDPSSPVPAVRVFPCGVWYQGALYIYGGLNMTNTYSVVTLYDDAWKFDLATRFWTKLTDHAPPGQRAAMTCDIIKETGLVHLSYGVKDRVDGFQDDNWTWKLSTNTWTLLTTSAVKPIARAIHTFARIPDTNNFLFLDGVSFANNSRRGGFDDQWIFNTDTYQWKQLNVFNPPATRNAFTGILTSKKYFFMHGGHIFTNQTIAENCLPPLSPCNADATSSDESYFLRLGLFDTSIWSNEANFEHSTPPLRRSWAILLKPFVYLVGGMGWSGKNGVGELYNYYTYGIQLKESYFLNI